MKINYYLIIISFMLGIAITFIINNYTEQNKLSQIKKYELEVLFKDTIIDNPNVCILVIDSVEYLSFKNGRDYKLIQHRDLRRGGE